MSSSAQIPDPSCLSTRAHAALQTKRAEAKDVPALQFLLIWPTYAQSAGGMIDHYVTPTTTETPHAMPRGHGTDRRY